MMKKLTALVLCLLPVLALAAEGGVPLHKASVDLGDRASLQRGAKVFVNYCLSCHSAHFERYNRMARDLGLTNEEVAKNLMFASDKVVSLMTVAMRPAESKKWFGKSPPDLSVMARVRGANWLYSYLISFYKDDNPERLFGVNNEVFPGVAMPDVLVNLQGVQERVFKEVEGTDGKKHKEFAGFKIIRPGSMSDGQFRRTVNDLVNFLVYLGEPAKLVRYHVGIWVLVFLAVFFLLARLLYKEYWKDVH